MEESLPEKPKSWYNWRMISLIIVHVYIVLHFTLWYVFDFQIWGKTAMMGVPSILAGNINTAAVMVFLICLSIIFYGRAFCGWACHMRGVIEFADWSMRKLNLKGYKKVRDKNVLINTRYRWLFRVGALYVLVAPILVIWLQNVGIAGDYYTFKPSTPPPLADLPGYEAKLFKKNFAFEPDSIFINPSIGELDKVKPKGVKGLSEYALAFCMWLFIWFVMGFMMNYFYGHSAFCRILCPYVVIFAPLMQLNPWQRKITRVDNCTGCRACSNACPQGIDVSREIFHYEGKVTNRECIKCYSCIDACDHGVLADTSAKASPQLFPRMEYGKKPWINEDEKHLQVFEPINPIVDFVSFVFALICGGFTCKLGGFWFYVGSILGYILFRKAVIFIQLQFQSFSSGKDKTKSSASSGEANPTPLQQE